MACEESLSFFLASGSMSSGTLRSKTTLWAQITTVRILFSGPVGAAYPCLYICFWSSSCETSRLLTSHPLILVLYICIRRIVNVRIRKIHQYMRSGYIFLERERERKRAVNTFQTGIRLSPYRGKILVALVDLLAEISAVTVDSYKKLKETEEEKQRGRCSIKTNRV